MNEWGTPGLPLADLPASKFWPRVTDNLKLEDSDLWQEELGLHPKSPLWDGVTKMMIRSPGRETGQGMTGLTQMNGIQVPPLCVTCCEPVLIFLPGMFRPDVRRQKSNSFCPT